MDRIETKAYEMEIIVNIRSKFIRETGYGSESASRTMVGLRCDDGIWKIFLVESQSEHTTEVCPNLCDAPAPVQSPTPHYPTAYPTDFV